MCSGPNPARRSPRLRISINCPSLYLRGVLSSTGRKPAGLFLGPNRVLVFVSVIPLEKFRWKRKFLWLVIMLDPRTFQTRGDFMFRRAVLIAALGGLFLVPTHARIVSAAADNPLVVSGR